MVFHRTPILWHVFGSLRFWLFRKRLKLWTPWGLEVPGICLFKPVSSVDIPFAPKCDQQRAKKSFVVFCRNGIGTGKKKRKKGKPSGLDFPYRSWLITCNLLPANTWSIILCPHRWTTCYGCDISEPKDSKIASFTRPAWWRPGMENTSFIYF